MVELPPHKRGCHVITRPVLQQLPELTEFEVGLANFFIQHTSASLTINENASSGGRGGRGGGGGGMQCAAATLCGASGAP